MSLAQNIKKTINYSKKNGYAQTALAAWERLTARYHADYRYEPPSEKELVRQRENSRKLSSIKFSIIVPAYETGREYLKELADSCLAQSYENWELIIADGSETDIVADTIKKYNDERIRYVRLEGNGGIAENTNRAIEYATGDYCGLLDHDDTITPDALYEIASSIAGSSFSPVILYSDEDKCDSEGRNYYEPHFKLDFNLDLILTNNYICHFMVVETQTLKKLQIRREYEGSQDFDIVLRVVSGLLLKEREGLLNDTTGRIEDLIVHVPKVLYHWRCHRNSTADNPQSKMYAYEAGKKALVDFAGRMGWKVDIRHNKHLGFYRIEYKNGALSHRQDIAAVGGYAVHNLRIASGKYRGNPVFYAGYMNRLDLYQNIEWLDIRCMEINGQYTALYEQITGHSYESTISGESLPQWLSELNSTKSGRNKIIELSSILSRELSKKGRLLLDPEIIRKI